MKIIPNNNYDSDESVKSAVTGDDHHDHDKNLE